MARSLCLKDGSTKLIFHEDDRLNVLAGLIQEYLGPARDSSWIGNA